jgi:hypothetical protein
MGLDIRSVSGIVFLFPVDIIPYPLLSSVVSQLLVPRTHIYFLYPVDIIPYPLLSSVVSQLLVPRTHAYPHGHQVSASALKTDDKGSTLRQDCMREVTTLSITSIRQLNLFLYMCITLFQKKKHPNFGNCNL